MKFSSACLALLAAAPSSSAFVVPQQQARRAARSSPLSVVTEAPEVNGKVMDKPSAADAAEAAAPIKVEVTKAEESPAVEEKKAEAAAKTSAPLPFAVELKEDAGRGALEPGRYATLDYSITLPFLPRPTNLDGSHAGDFGFDPLGLSQEYDMYYMQECELRHARLAMLAVVGWPLSELLAPDFMLQDGCAPSVLNGFNPISGAAVAAMFAAMGVLEYATALRSTWDTKIGEKHTKDMANIWDNGVAGDYNFDPMDFYNLLGDDADGRKALRQLEVTQGRYAMLGITYFALWEAVSGSPIVENNMFFTPNLVLPVLGAAYLAATTLYEFSDVTTYPIKLQKSKLGLELDEWLERRAESY